MTSCAPLSCAVVSPREVDSRADPRGRSLRTDDGSTAFVRPTRDGMTMFARRGALGIVTRARALSSSSFLHAPAPHFSAFRRTNAAHFASNGAERKFDHVPKWSQSHARTQQPHHGVDPRAPDVPRMP